MTAIRTAERETYEAVWALAQYAEMSPGERYVQSFLQMSGAAAGQSVIDAGCGSGKGAIELARLGFDVRMCDLTDAGLIDEAKALRFDTACLWHPLRPQLGYMRWGSVDWVYCCDLMEHVPPPFTMLVAMRLLEICRKGVFFSICLQSDLFGAWVGKPLHQTVQGFTQWRDQLKELGRMVECRHFLQVNTGLYLVAPK